MGNEGLSVIRYGGRYYAKYAGNDDSAEGLWSSIACDIPTNPQKFREYLEYSINHMKKREMEVMKYLCRRRTDYMEESVRPMQGTTVTNPGCECNAWPPESSAEDDERREHKSFDSVYEENISMPTFFPPGKSFHAKWRYTVDYDNMAFTVNDSAHLHLDRIPGDRWIAALSKGLYTDDIFVPDMLPPDTITSIAASIPSPDSTMSKLYESLEIRFVKAQGIAGFQPWQRHGPVFRSCINESFRPHLAQPLSCALLSWKPDDLPFRETAFAILNLASGGHTALVRFMDPIRKGRDGFSDLVQSATSAVDSLDKPEFLAHFWTGSHLQGNPPGSPPLQTLYWFEGALVYLVQRLTDPSTVSTSIAIVQQRCIAERPQRPSNALLLSVEHVVLLRIYPDGNRVDRTKVLALFDILTHRSLDPDERYNKRNISSQLHARTVALSRYQRFKEKRESRETNDSVAPTPEELAEEDAALDISFWTKFDDELRPRGVGSCYATQTFFRLARFLEATMRESLPPERIFEGNLPSELYVKVLQDVYDVQTYRACMQVSRKFRNICLERCVIADGMAMKPSLWTKRFEFSNDDDEEDKEEFGKDTREEKKERDRAEGNKEHEEANKEEADEQVDQAFTFEMEWERPLPRHLFGGPFNGTQGKELLDASKAGAGLMNLFSELKSPVYPKDLLRWWVPVLGNESNRRTLLPWIDLSIEPVEEQNSRWTFESTDSS